jgi:hypothetical protein
LTEDVFGLELVDFHRARMVAGGRGAGTGAEDYKAGRRKAEGRRAGASAG